MLTTAYTAQNFILDLFSTDPSLGYVEVLRQECEDALRETGGKWSFETVKRLRLVDSAIRESMRMSPFGTLTLPRKVGLVCGLHICDQNAEEKLDLGPERYQVGELGRARPKTYADSSANGSHPIRRNYLSEPLPIQPLPFRTSR